jgi:hypothetical protein
METLYNVYFAGEVLPGHQAANVREGLATLFKASDATLDKLFSGSPQLVKRECDKATALKYKQALERAGAKPLIKRCDSANAAPGARDQARKMSMAERVAALAAGAAGAGETASPAVTSRPAPGDADASMTLAPTGAEVLRPEERQAAAPRDVDTSSLTLASAGAPLAAPAPPAPPAPDTSRLSMGEVGEDIPTLPREEPGPEPDTSGIDLCPEGSDFSDCATGPAADPGLDLSALELAPAGSDIVEARYRQTDAPRPPDTTHLSLDEPGQ